MGPGQCSTAGWESATCRIMAAGHGPETAGELCKDGAAPADHLHVAHFRERHVCGAIPAALSSITTSDFVGLRLHSAI